MVHRFRRRRFRSVRRRRTGRSLRRPRFRRSRRRFRIRPERKYINYIGTFTVSTTAGNFEVSDMIQGVGNDQRIGNRLVFKKFVIGLRADIASSNISSNIRVLLVHDKTVGATTSVAVNDVISPVGPDPMTQLYSVVNSPLYHVVRDWVLKLDTADHPHRFVRSVIKLNTLAQFEGAGIGQQNKGKYRLMFFSDQSVAANQPLFRYVIRLYYEDV